jgi:hypothetical protein
MLYSRQGAYMWENMYFYLWDLQTGMITLYGEMEKGVMCKIA